VLRAVLAKLEREGDLDRAAGHQPLLGMDAETLEMVRDVKQGESVDALRSRLLVARKRRDLEGLIERSPFVLIEGQWRVVQSDAGRELAIDLAELKSPFLAYDSYGHGPDGPAQETLPMPDGIAIFATFPTDSLTTTRRMAGSSSSTKDGGARTKDARSEDAPWEGYDGHTEAEVIEGIEVGPDGGQVEAIEHVWIYELAHRRRVKVVECAEEVLPVLPEPAGSWRGWIGYVLTRPSHVPPDRESSFWGLPPGRCRRAER
jgi:hypothetical protein